ncbi:unnamed protein product [Ranitomeya imitator]|uniref:Uncharacterized protein n=1 Tax=Ranitomeya imitator TaxID=111125 RepID=A0ABN9LLQ4_9NEOB|nr:unnamed protein product [Ranitomeya imitator]
MECTDAQPQLDYYAVPLTQITALPSLCTEPESDPDETMVLRPERYSTLHGDTEEGAHDIEKEVIDDPVVDPDWQPLGKRVPLPVAQKQRRMICSSHLHRKSCHLAGPYLAKNLVNDVFIKSDPQHLMILAGEVCSPHFKGSEHYEEDDKRHGGHLSYATRHRLLVKLSPRISRNAQRCSSILGLKLPTKETFQIVYKARNNNHMNREEVHERKNHCFPGY